MKRLYLVRHGETAWNSENRIQGSVDVPLSEKGLRQARALGDYLAEGAHGIDRIYTSDLSRSFETGRVVARRLGLPEPHCSPLLRETHCGEWEGRRIDDLREKEPGTYWNWIDHADVPCPGGESILQVRDRVARFFFEENGLNDAPTVLIVGHGLLNRMVLSVLLHIDAQTSRFFSQDNTAVNVFEWGRMKVYVKAWNVLPHLEGNSC
ncbi:MAG: histidine phosphatase family protein [Acidobacteriota bacterium]|jgi:phosphoserine phosphatase